MKIYCWLAAKSCINTKYSDGWLQKLARRQKEWIMSASLCMLCVYNSTFGNILANSSNQSYNLVVFPLLHAQRRRWGKEGESTRHRETFLNLSGTFYDEWWWLEAGFLCTKIPNICMYLCAKIANICVKICNYKIKNTTQKIFNLSLLCSKR